MYMSINTSSHAGRACMDVHTCTLMRVLYGYHWPPAPSFVRNSTKALYMKSVRNAKAIQTISLCKHDLNQYFRLYVYMQSTHPINSGHQNEGELYSIYTHPHCHFLVLMLVHLYSFACEQLFVELLNHVLSPVSKIRS